MYIRNCGRSNLEPEMLGHMQLYGYHLDEKLVSLASELPSKTQPELMSESNCDAYEVFLQMMMRIEM